MDYNNVAIANAFESARLQYVKVDMSDEALKAWLPNVVQDPVIQAMAAPLVLQPKSKKDCDSYLESVAKSLLGVVVHLLPDEKARLDLGNDEESTMIGIMCIGWGGISQAVAHHRNAHIGISLAQPYQGKGYGREAIDWMLDWGFRHAGLHCIGIDAASYNVRAVNLYRSMGFREEGRRRETIWQNRKWYDLVEFGMTEQEWEKLRGLGPVE